MTKMEAIERAAAIWTGLLLTITMRDDGGCLVDVDDDYRVHGLDNNGHVSCGHPNCLEREDKVR